MTMAEIVDKFGGQTSLAKALGMSVGTVGAWKCRGSIPSGYWAKIVEAARERQIDVSLANLAEAAPPPRPPNRRKPNASQEENRP